MSDPTWRVMRANIHMTLINRRASHPLPIVGFEFEDVLLLHPFGLSGELEAECVQESGQRAEIGQNVGSVRGKVQVPNQNMS